MTYYPAIDGLRAVAVLSVVLYHAGFTTLFGGGYTGVDIFFVISGYLISSIIFRQMQAGTFSFVDFYTRRLRRIMPALFVCLAVTTLAASQILIQDFKAFCGALMAAVLMVANIWFCFNSGYFDAPAKNIPLLHTWSLGVEEQFYIVFPLLMLLLMRKPRALFPLLALCCAGSFALSIYYVYTNVNFAFYALHTRAWELLAGSLLAVHGPCAFSARQCRLCIATGLAIVAAAVVGYGHIYVLFPGFAAIPPVLGAVLCIAGAISCTEDSPPRTLLHLRPLVFVGLISYSLYLWHWPVLVLYKHATESYAGLPTLVALGLVTVIFVLAWLSWKFVETPVRCRQLLGRPAALYAACAVFGLCLTVTGWLGYEGHLEWRLPAKARAFAVQAQNGSALTRELPDLPAPLAQRAFYFGKGGEAPTVLVLGDSHALALGQAFDTVAREHGVAGILVWTHSPLLGAHNPHDSKDSRQYQQDVRALIAKYPTLRKAVLALRWAYYTDGSKAHEKELFRGDTYGFEVDDLPSVHSATRPPTRPGKGGALSPVQAAEYGLQNTLDFLRGKGLEVWVMHGVPEQNVDIPRRAARLSLWGVAHPDKELGLTLEEHRQRNAHPDALLRKLLPDATHRLDPAEVLCGEGGPCRAADGDTLWYYDDDHLSVAGSMQLAPLLDKVFATPLRRR